MGRPGTAEGPGKGTQCGHVSRTWWPRGYGLMGREQSNRQGGRPQAPRTSLSCRFQQTDPMHIARVVSKHFLSSGNSVQPITSSFPFPPSLPVFRNAVSPSDRASRGTDSCVQSCNPKVNTVLFISGSRGLAQFCFIQLVMSLEEVYALSICFSVIPSLLLQSFWPLFPLIEYFIISFDHLFMLPVTVLKSQAFTRPPKTYDTFPRSTGPGSGPSPRRADLTALHSAHPRVPCWPPPPHTSRAKSPCGCSVVSFTLSCWA